MSQRLSEMWDGIGKEILRTARNELYLNMRFLDLALCSLRYQMDAEAQTAGTDGYLIYFEPYGLSGLFEGDRTGLNRLYLHMVLHCLFRHLTRRGARKAALWHLACDIAAEYILDGLPLRCLRNPPKPYRRAVYDGLLKKIPVIHGEAVFHLLEKAGPDIRTVARLVQEFTVDDHGLWQKGDSGPKSPMEQQNQWKDIRDKMETELEIFSKEAAEGSKGLKEQLRVENRERYDYREFLRKFCVLKEEMQVDLDSFDYIFYNYGMELYGNMPLIEHQETREMQRVEDFVIVIDTSMSCKSSLVRKFLEETYSILSQSESFARRFCIHIIQCDERVQSDTVIEGQKQLAAYMEQFQVQGMGGTDFRPAFAYVDRLLAEKKFQKLRGLIYFTDGYGVYPLRKPVYDTAFVFFREDYQDVDVPPWAIKLILGGEELEEKRKKE